MKIESTTRPKTERITGTLHRRGYVQPIPSQGEDSPSEETVPSEIAGQHENSGQQDHESAR